jgi:hypothetical protein
MRVRTVLALALAAAVPAGVALASPRAGSPPVSIRIEGLHKTLILPKQVRTGSGWITKYGAPKGKCPARSVQGALDVATHGHWKGTWSTQYNEYFVTSILGEKPSGHDFWEIFVNNKAANKGACDLKPQRGEELLFADTDGKHNPSALDVIGRSADGSSFLVKLVGYNAQGRSKPLAGVRITGNGIHSATTNAHGRAEITDHHSGRLVLRASPSGYIRSETTAHVK